MRLLILLTKPLIFHTSGKLIISFTPPRSYISYELLMILFMKPLTDSFGGWNSWLRMSFIKGFFPIFSYSSSSSVTPANT